MTIPTIEVAKALVDEMQGQGLRVGSVWEYRNKVSKSLLFAVFPIDQHCDIYESPYVEKPIRIWRDGLWIKHYEYLNESDIDGE